MSVEKYDSSNECSTVQSVGTAEYTPLAIRRWGYSNAGALGKAEYPFIANDPWSTLSRSGST